MTIPFKNIPSNIRTPLFFAEVDPSHANTAQINQRALIIGQITGAGIATPDLPIISQGVADAKSQGGLGSMLARMVDAYRKNDQFGEVWYLPLADNSAGAFASGNISFTGPATVAGTLALYIAGDLISVGVSAAMTATQLAAAVIAAISAASDLPVTAGVDGTHDYQVNLTARNKGLVGNDIDIRFNYQGLPSGESTPTGISFTITAMSGGTANPSLANGLAALVDKDFDFIVLPFSDTTSLNAMKDFLGDSTGRWSWESQIYGHCFVALRGTFGSLVTAGQLRNDPHTSIMGFNDSPSQAYQWAAAVAAQTAVSVRADPGVPMQTVALLSILASPLSSRFSLTERNSLLFDGISTFTVALDGTVQIENLITTYQKNGFGQVDNSLLQIETLFTLMFVLRALAVVITTKYARVKLAADGTRFAPGSNIVTPKTIKADLIAQYQSLEYDGVVQQSKEFAAALVVEINSNNPNRIDVLYPAVLINQLRIFALLAQFRLQ